MAVKLSDLEKHLDEVYKIVVDLSISLVNAKRLTIEKYCHEQRIVRHGFFQHHQYQLRFIMAIQIAKLFSKTDNQKINLHKLLNKVENDIKKKELENRILENLKKPFVKVFRSKDEMKNEIRMLRDRIESLQPHIDKIIQLRDKVYAHKDPTEVAIPAFAIEDAEPIIILAAEIYNVIGGGLFDIHHDFSRDSNWQIDDIIRECNFARQARISNNQQTK